MADSADSTPSRRDEDASWRLHQACLAAKARVDMASCALDEASLAEEIAAEATQAELCRAHVEALERYLLHPVCTPGLLAMKLDTFNREDGCSLVRGPEFAAVFAADARRIAEKLTEENFKKPR